MTQHTRGPWLKNKRIGKDTFCILFRNNDDPGRTHRLDNLAGEFSEADACLIEAAPELLEEGMVVDNGLTWLCDQLRNRQGSRMSADEVKDFTQSLIAFAEAYQIGLRAAIAKARGQS